MNILHTSDWHLGKYLENRERLPEQVEVMDELCRIAEVRKVDLVIIAGDIFDTFVPPAAAEELFFNTIERLSAKGRRAVVIIAGNHDSP
ncbi:MAG TPA: exonuclease subunit SbcD, partial [Bacillota bacterium]|nr:exonuclease subunit SbcD [Bacillota bacterium]